MSWNCLDHFLCKKNSTVLKFNALLFGIEVVGGNAFFYFLITAERTVTVVANQKAGWYIWFEKSGKDNAPKKIAFEGETIHVRAKGFGYSVPKRNTAILN